MGNNDVKEINELIDEVWKQLKLNEKALETDKPFQTEGLEDKVKNVCTKVTALPAEVALAFEPELTKMITFLTDLSERMQAKRLAVMENAEELNKREKAMKAYGSQPSKKNNPDS